MARIFGAPFNSQARLRRWLGHGAGGLASGMSEAAAPVSLDDKTSGGSGVAAAGAVGPPGTTVGDNRMSRGFKMWALPVPGVTTPIAYNATWSAGSTSPALAVATNDIDALPRLRVVTGAGVDAANFVATNIADFVIGQGDGRGGFIMDFRFAFEAVQTARRWFVGVWGGASSGTARLNFIGVGQDPGDSVAQLIYADATTETKLSTGITILANTVYEARVFSDPFGSGLSITFEEFVGGVSSNFSGVEAVTGAGAPDTTTTPLDAHVEVGAGPGGGANVIVFLGWYAELQPPP